MEKKESGTYMIKSFRDKVAVITGAGSGMGRYLAILLAKDGADVVVCDVNQETLNETVEMLRQYNVSVSSLSATSKI